MAGARVSITVTSNRFPQMPGLARAAIGRALEREGKDVLIDMQNQTPVSEEQHEHLVATETVVVSENTMTLSAGHGLPDARALYVHEGAHAVAARPYMRQALEAAVPDVVAAISDELEAGLR